jgi:hypothetical protein
MSPQRAVKAVSASMPIASISRQVPVAAATARQVQDTVAIGRRTDAVNVDLRPECPGQPHELVVGPEVKA